MGSLLPADHDYIRDDRVRLGESEPGAEVQAAICDYSFGQPERVAEVVKLEGMVTLNRWRAPLQLAAGAGTANHFASSPIACTQPSRSAVRRSGSPGPTRWSRS